MNEAAQQPQAAESTNPFAGDSNWIALVVIIGYGFYRLIFNSLANGWPKALAFFLAQGAGVAVLIWKMPPNKLRWALIPCWLICSIGLYCLYQFPDRKGTIRASIFALIAISLLSVWAIPKWQSVKKAASP